MKETAPPLRSQPQRAIADALTSEIARQAAGLWGGTLTDPDPVRAVQNYVFAIEREGRPGHSSPDP